MAQQVSFDRMVRETADIPADLIYKRKHDPSDLVRAYLNAVGRGKRFLPPPKDRFTEIVARRFVSVSSQIVFVLKRLLKKREIGFKSIFEGKTDSSERVAAFLAILELVKGKRVRIEGENENSVIKLVNRREDN